MENYVSPNAELITFESDIVMATSPSGCNCFADRWNEGHAIDSGCTGTSYDYEELVWSA